MIKPPIDERQIAQPRRRKIPNTDFYEIDEYGFVYRHNKKLSLSYRSGEWYAKVRDKNGRQWQFNSEKVARKLFGEEELQLSREDIEVVIGARAIPDYPRYSITDYGAVYCVEPPRRGKYAGRRYLLKETLNRGHPYVTLYNYDGTRRCVRLSKLVEMVWGD
tara:strand:+ start:560 stop:1045 length:486 start_codon:yes stop_codon:yes gene_type:complete